MSVFTEERTPDKDLKTKQTVLQWQDGRSKQVLDGNIVKEEVFSVLLWRCQTKHMPCSPDLYFSTEVNAPGDSVVSDTDRWRYIKHRLTWRLLPSQEEWANSNTYTLIYCRFLMFYSSYISNNRKEKNTPSIHKKNRLELTVENSAKNILGCFCLLACLFIF